MVDRANSQTEPSKQELKVLARRLLDENGVSVGEIIKGHGECGFTGFTYSNELVIGAPWPVTTLGELFVLAHEIGHVRLHVRRDRNGWYRLVDQPRYRLEYEAERFARDWFAKQGLTVSGRLDDGARANVRAAIKQALVAGEVEIDQELAAWSGLTALDIERLRDEVHETGTIAAAGPEGDVDARCELGRTHSNWRTASGRVGLRELLFGLLVLGVLLAIWARLDF